MDAEAEIRSLAKTLGVKVKKARSTELWIPLGWWWFVCGRRKSPAKTLKEAQFAAYPVGVPEEKMLAMLRACPSLPELVEMLASEAKGGMKSEAPTNQNGTFASL